MSSKAIHQKTFGIKNETWFEKFYSIGLLIIIIPTISLVVELTSALNFGVPPIEKCSDYLVFFHLLGFFVLQFMIAILMLTGSIVPPQKYKNLVWSIGSLTIFTAFYLYNPSIDSIKKEAELAQLVMKYTLMIQSISLPIFLLNSIFACFILLKAARIQYLHDNTMVKQEEEDANKKLMETF
ncbi:hypothetical protein GCK72_007650 [Caenorhabditis remanei]|uniref:Uncharacterized protein n=1 Tax=Caenorhabditis remanei TaxID=31234 RepID=A0A6A5HKN3_CAERE|nr:hypothetical protein GCK72_007650 [Caenorhabditis remanei]KAF1767691.1 hypothetical protein GCK72_007650 [Caenorhabditis remanei]